MIKLDAKETMAAQAYAAYMIATSYFGSYKCVTPQMEKKTEHLYRLQSIENQYKMEDRIKALMEKQVLPQISEELLDSQVEVAFLSDGSGVRITDGLEFVLEIRQSVREIDYGKNEKRTEIALNAKIFDVEEE